MVVAVVVVVVVVVVVLVVEVVVVERAAGELREECDRMGSRMLVCFTDAQFRSVPTSRRSSTSGRIASRGFEWPSETTPSFFGNSPFLLERSPQPEQRTLDLISRTELSLCRNNG